MKTTQPIFGLTRCAMRAALAVALAGTATLPAQAIVIAGGGSDPAPDNDTAPLVDPGWDRIGVVGNGTGIYLGNGFVLTANHVSSKTSITIGGETFNKISGANTGYSVTNNDPELTTFTDLYIFRVAVPEGSILAGLDPLGITPVSIASSGQTGTWIGTGRGQVQSIPVNLGGGFTGFNVDDIASRDKRWAVMEAGAVVTGTSGSRDIVGFRSTFTNTLNDGMAAAGDSGGGLFWAGPNGNEFDAPVLAGISFAVGTGEGQPADTAAFNNYTYFIDAFEYRDQLLTYNGDLSGNGIVDEDDLALVLTHWGSGVQAGNWLLGDGDGDGVVGLDDLRWVLNNWSEGEAPSVAQALSMVPEPGSLALMALGAVLIVRRRR